MCILLPRLARSQWNKAQKPLKIQGLQAFSKIVE